MDENVLCSVQALLKAESELHNASRMLRKAEHAGPRDYVPSSDEAQALATLIYNVRRRVEAMHR